MLPLPFERSIKEKKHTWQIKGKCLPVYDKQKGWLLISRFKNGQKDTDTKITLLGADLSTLPSVRNMGFCISLAFWVSRAIA